MHNCQGVEAPWPLAFSRKATRHEHQNRTMPRFGGELGEEKAERQRRLHFLAVAHPGPGPPLLGHAGAVQATHIPPLPFVLKRHVPGDRNMPLPIGVTPTSSNKTHTSSAEGDEIMTTRGGRRGEKGRGGDMGSLNGSGMAK